MPDEEGNNQNGESAVAVPPNPAVKAAQDEAALVKAQAEKAKAEKEIVEHQRDKMKAELMPVAASDKTTAPTGDVTTDQAGFVETQILGQEATQKIAALLARDLEAHPNLKRIVIYNAADIAALTIYGALLQELKQLSGEFALKSDDADEIIGKTEDALTAADFESSSAIVGTAALTAALAAPAVAAGAVKSVAELVNLFRSATEIKNKSLTGAEDYVISYLVNEFSRTNPRVIREVYYPAMFPPRLLASSEKTELVKALNGIRASKFTAQENVKKIDALAERLTAAQTEIQSDLQKKKVETAAKEAEIGKLAADDPKRLELQEALQTLRDDERNLKRRFARLKNGSLILADLKTKLQYLATIADQLFSGLETPDAATKTTPLAKLLIVAQLRAILEDAQTFTLRFTVAANGTTKIKKNLFWNADVLHSGGASLTYQLFDRKGIVARANGFQRYFDWKSSEQIKSMLDDDNNLATDGAVAGAHS